VTTDIDDEETIRQVADQLKKEFPDVQSAEIESTTWAEFDALSGRRCAISSEFSRNALRRSVSKDPGYLTAPNPYSPASCRLWESRPCWSAGSANADTSADISKTSR
jgi:hypothetical protein